LPLGLGWRARPVEDELFHDLDRQRGWRDGAPREWVSTELRAHLYCSNNTRDVVSTPRPWICEEKSGSTKATCRSVAARACEVLRGRIGHALGVLVDHVIEVALVLLPSRTLVWCGGGEEIARRISFPGIVTIHALPTLPACTATVCRHIDMSDPMGLQRGEGSTLVADNQQLLTVSHRLRRDHGRDQGRDLLPCRRLVRCRVHRPMHKHRRAD